MFMTPFEEIKKLHAEGNLREARLVFAKEYLGDGTQRTGENMKRDDRAIASKFQGTRSGDTGIAEAIILIGRIEERGG